MIDLRLGTAEDDEVVVDAYLAVWESYGVPAEHFSGDKRASVREFLAISRNQYEGGVVMAGHDAIIVGSVGYQVQVPQFPEVLRRDIRKGGLSLDCVRRARGSWARDCNRDGLKDGRTASSHWMHDGRPSRLGCRRALVQPSWVRFRQRDATKP